MQLPGNFARIFRNRKLGAISFSWVEMLDSLPFEQQRMSLFVALGQFNTPFYDLNF